jgi:hypothetical protein
MNVCGTQKISGILKNYFLIKFRNYQESNLKGTTWLEIKKRNFVNSLQSTKECVINHSHHTLPSDILLAALFVSEPIR